MGGLAAPAVRRKVPALSPLFRQQARKLTATQALSMRTMKFRIKCNPNPKPGESYAYRMSLFWISYTPIIMFSVIMITDDVMILLGSLEEIEYNELTRMMNHMPGSRGKFEGDEWNHKTIGWGLLY